MSAPTPQADDGTDLIGIERALRAVEHDSQRGVRIVNDAFREWQDTRRAYDQAKAHAYLRARVQEPKPTIPEVEAMVEIATVNERAAMDHAKAVHQYAVDRTDDIADRRSSLQTRAKLVMEQMRLAGIGQP